MQIGDIASKEKSPKSKRMKNRGLYVSSTEQGRDVVEGPRAPEEGAEHLLTNELPGDPRDKTAPDGLVD